MEHTANAEVRSVVLEHLNRFEVVTAAFDKQLRNAVQNRQVVTTAVPGADSVRSEAAWFRSRGHRRRQLMLLQMHIAQLDNAVGFGSGLAVLLAIYLFFGFYLSIASPIRMLVATLNAVAAGDLTQRVVVKTHDELSLVGRALNDTIAKTEVATDRLAEQATHNHSLTELPNRAFVLHRLSRALSLTGSGDAAPMAVLFIDLDRFEVPQRHVRARRGPRVYATVSQAGWTPGGAPPVTWMARLCRRRVRGDQRVGV